MGPPDLTLQEVTEAAEAVREAAVRPGQHHLRDVGRRDARRSAVGHGDRDRVRAARGREAQGRARALARPLAAARARDRRRSRRPVLPARLALPNDSGPRGAIAAGHPVTARGRGRDPARGRLGRRRVRRGGVRLVGRRARADRPGRRRLPGRLRRRAPASARARLLHGRARLRARRRRSRRWSRTSSTSARAGRRSSSARVVRRAGRDGRSRGGAPAARPPAVGRAHPPCGRARAREASR